MQNLGFRRFLINEDAAISVEFVIIFPLLLMLTLLIIFVSMFLSTASDVQQIAHDLSRASFRYVGDTTAANLCQKLKQTILPSLLEASFLLDASRFTLEPCTNVPDAQGFITIKVKYDFAGSFVQSLAQNFNLNLGIIQRSSRIMI